MQQNNQNQQGAESNCKIFIKYLVLFAPVYILCLLSLVLLILQNIEIDKLRYQRSHQTQFQYNIPTKLSEVNQTQTHRKYLKNADIVGSGYDPTMRKSFSLYAQREQGLKLQLFNFTLQEQICCMDGQFLIPEYTNWRHDLQCSGDVKHEVINSYEKYVRFLTQNVKIDDRGRICFGFWIFEKCISYDDGFSRESQKYKKHIQEFQSVYHHFFYKCLFYSGGFLPNIYPNLHQGFVEALAQLPQNFDKSDPNIFYKFFKDYGTHFIHHATLGGQIGQVYQLSETFSNILLKKFRRDAMLAKFGAFSSQRQKASEIQEFLNKFARSQSKYGTNTESNSLLEWMKNAVEDPSPIEFEIAPISNLLQLVKKRKLTKYNFNNYESRLAALQQAIATYIQSRKQNSIQQAKKITFNPEITSLEPTNDSTLGNCSFCYTCGKFFPRSGGWIDPPGDIFFGLGSQCGGFPTIQKLTSLHLCCSPAGLQTRGFCRFIKLQDETPQDSRFTLMGKMRISEAWVYDFSGFGYQRRYHGQHDVGLVCTNKMCALCRTCGGQYGFFQGAFWLNWQVISLGNQCEGDLHPTSDAYGAKLCCRNTFTGQTYDDLEYGINE